MYCTIIERDHVAMKFNRYASVAAVLACALFVSACANTIRGVGQDAKDSAKAVESVVE